MRVPGPKLIRAGRAAFVPPFIEALIWVVPVPPTTTALWASPITVVGPITSVVLDDVLLLVILRPLVDSRLPPAMLARLIVCVPVTLAATVIEDAVSVCPRPDMRV